MRPMPRKVTPAEHTRPPAPHPAAMRRHSRAGVPLTRREALRFPRAPARIASCRLREAACPHQLGKATPPARLFARGERFGQDGFGARSADGNGCLDAMVGWNAKLRG